MYNMKNGISPFSRPTTAKKGLSSPVMNKKEIQIPYNSQQTKTVPSEEQQESKPQKSLANQIQINKLYEQLQDAISSQKECERNGKYVEAEAYKRRVGKLRESLQNFEINTIKNRHHNEVEELEYAHLEEMNIFNLEWDKGISEYNKNIERMYLELENKHNQQITNIQFIIQNQKGSKFKESPTLLELRKIQKELAKQENYIEAHKVQVKAEKVQKQEFEKWKKNNSTKNRQDLNLLKQKHENQLKAMNMRIQLQVEEKERERQRQQEKLLQKYENIITETTFHQNQELIKFNKQIKLTQLQKKTKIGVHSSSKKIN